MKKKITVYQADSYDEFEDFIDDEVYAKKNKQKNRHSQDLDPDEINSASRRSLDKAKHKRYHPQEINSDTASDW